MLAKLANQHSLTELGTPASHPSDAIIFETVRTDGLAHLSYLIGDRSSGRAAVMTRAATWTSTWSWPANTA